MAYPGEGQQKLFEPDNPVAVPTETELAIARGTETALHFMQDPDSFGPDWPSLVMNKLANENSAVAAQPIPVPEETAPFKVETRFIKGQSYLCAVTPDDEIIYSRGLGKVGSPELYDLVSAEAEKMLAAKAPKAE